MATADTTAILRTRPNYHYSDAAIRGHVFCSFLALMRKRSAGGTDFSFA